MRWVCRAQVMSHGTKVGEAERGHSKPDEAAQLAIRDAVEEAAQSENPSMAYERMTEIKVGLVYVDAKP